MICVRNKSQVRDVNALRSGQRSVFRITEIFGQRFELN